MYLPSSDILFSCTITLSLTQLSTLEQQTVSYHLKFISQFTTIAKEHNVRVIISGGYAVDGALGVITRPHEDIDVQIYTTSSNGEETIKQLLDILGTKSKLIEKERSDFYQYFHLPLNNSFVEFYYLHVTTDPFADEKIVVKKDGTKTDPHAYNTISATLHGVSFEAQDPVTEFADRIYKRDFRGDPKKKKHEQDIHNLRYITEDQEVQKRLDVFLGTRS